MQHPPGHPGETGAVQVLGDGGQPLAGLLHTLQSGVDLEVEGQGRQHKRVFHFSSLKSKRQNNLAYIATIYSKTFAAKIRIFGRHLKPLFIRFD